MPRDQLSAAVRHLRRLAGPPATEALTDAQLLRRFVAERDESAFAALVSRHEPLLRAVCRRALGSAEDAEDALQATLLVFARKAASVRKGTSLAGWLYRVAYHTAMNAKRTATRRRAHEAQAPQRLPETPVSEAALRELQALLDEEVQRLPEKHRAVFVLCCLEGKSKDEAAHELGWKAGTVSGRLARAREQLQQRLARRGVALSAALCAAALGPGTPSTLSAATVQAVLACAAGNPSAMSAAAVLLADGVTRMLFLTKLKLVAVSFLLLGVLAAGTGLAARQVFSPKAPQTSSRAGARPADLPKPAEQVRARTDRYGDPLPAGAVLRLGTVRLRLDGLFYACAFSPDGRLLAAGSTDRTVHLFDAATGRPIRRFRGHQADVLSLAFSPDGKTLASGSADRTLAIWEVSTGKLLRRFHAHDFEVFSLAFTRDGRTLVSGGTDQLVRFWDPATGKELKRLPGHQGAVWCVALSPDGRTVASANSASTVIRLWDVATGQTTRRLTGPGEAFRSLAFSPDGRLLAAGKMDGTTWLWDVGAGRVVRRLPEDIKELRSKLPGSVWTVAFSPDGKTLAAGGKDHAVRFWDVATGKMLRERPAKRFTTGTGRHEGGVQCVAFSPDGKRLAFGEDNRLGLLDAASGKEVLRLPGHAGAVRRVFFAPDGRTLITAGDDQDRRLLEWDLTSGRPTRQLTCDVLWPRLMALSPDRKVLASTWFGPALHLWDTRTCKEIRRISLPLQTSNSSPQGVAFSPDGKLLAVAGLDGDGSAIGLWEAATAKERCRLEGTVPGIAFLSFSPDGRLLTSGGHKMIHLWETATGRHHLRIPVGKDGVATAAAFSPDGRALASAISGPTIPPALTLREVATGKARLSFAAPPAQVSCVTFSPDGRLLAAGGEGRNVTIWDVLTGKRLRELAGHTGAVESLSFSPDGRRLASASRDTTVLVWDVAGPPAGSPPRVSDLSPGELEAAWQDLAGPDAARAYRAILALSSSPSAVPFLRERLPRRAGRIEEDQIRRLIADLDSDRFEVREQAGRELERLGERAEPALRRALASRPSAEVRRRLDQLARRLGGPLTDPEALRDVRAVEALERSATAGARPILERLARGKPYSRLTREAKSALRRLAPP